ncbi:MAG: hypothetical protein ACK5O2_15530 [Microthrixaceae bacterium]
MNILDGLDIAAVTSKRAAVAIALAFIVCFLASPMKTTNFLYGQTLDSTAAAFNPVLERWDIHCVVHQDGLVGSPTIVCE